MDINVLYSTCLMPCDPQTFLCLGVQVNDASALIVEGPEHPYLSRGSSSQFNPFHHRILNLKPWEALPITSLSVPNTLTPLIIFIYA